MKIKVFLLKLKMRLELLRHDYYNSAYQHYKKLYDNGERNIKYFLFPSQEYYLIPQEQYINIKAMKDEYWTKYQASRDKIMKLQRRILLCTKDLKDL